MPREGSISQAEFDELLEPLKHIQVPPCPSEEAFVCDGALYGFEVVLGSTRFFLPVAYHFAQRLGADRPVAWGRYPLAGTGLKGDTGSNLSNT